MSSKLLTSLRKKWKNLWSGRFFRPQSFFRRDASQKFPSTGPGGRRKALVRSRPAHLASSSYELLDNVDQVWAMFLRLRSELIDHNYGTRHHPEHGQVPKARLEHGFLTGDKPYFYLQPWNSHGYLFEGDERGWVVSRADKNVGTQTFIRDYIPWDVVRLYRPASGKGLPRIVSQRFGKDYVSFPFYQSRLINQLDKDLTWQP